MSMKGSMRPLAQLHGEATERLLLDAALEALVHDGGITARAAALRAGISERTVFRYWPSRSGFLAACAAHFARRVEVPAPPATLAQLRAFPRALFTAFETHRELVRASWHSDLRSHMIARVSGERWVAIRKLVDGAAPGAAAAQRRLAAASIQYHLTASTWHYYRFVMRLSAEETIQGVEQVVAQQLGALARPALRTRSAPTRRVAKR